MKYKAVIKSAREITGIECNSFELIVNGWHYEYTEKMNQYNGERRIFKIINFRDTLVYSYNHNDYLPDWIEGIEPMSLRDEFKFELAEKGLNPTGINWWSEYAEWLEKKLENK